VKIAVFGATGSTGRKVIERALALGHEVMAIARRPQAIAAARRFEGFSGGRARYCHPWRELSTALTR
jgi:uncharacterized protein YbjT (DUF2867 family)